MAVVAMGPDAALDEPAIRDAVSNRLANYKQPKRIVAVDALPRNAMGKVEKDAVRALVRERFSTDTA